jgi:hypothetical protein
MAGQTLYAKVQLRASSTATLFDAVTGYRVKLLKGCLAFANCTATAVVQILEDSATAAFTVGTPSKGAVFNFDWSPGGLSATATSTCWDIRLVGSSGTVTAWFIGTTE